MYTTRFPNGLTNVSETNPLGNMGQPDPTKFITYFEDFVNSSSFPIATSGLAAASTSAWTVTVTEAGAGNAASALVDDHGGAVSLTTDAADNDLIFVQAKPESFLMAVGKKNFGKIRFKITDSNANAASINETEWYFGLMVTDTDPLSSTAGDGVTDGIFFMSEDGTQDIKFYVQKDTTTGQLTTTVATGGSNSTLTVATYTEFAWFYDGGRTVHLYKDGSYLQGIDLTATPTDYLPNTEVTVSFGVKNGEAVAKVMTVDYLFAAQER